MTNKITYKELVDFCDGAQNNRDVFGWETLKEFDHSSQNKNFNAKI